MVHEVIIITGVSGSGKTTIGKLLAEQLKGNFYDADSFHPESNIDKMSQGVPLQDEDRWPWLKIIANFVIDNPTNDPQIIACSALKESYRSFLEEIIPTISWVHLHGAIDIIKKRLQKREGHFMPGSLLQSQFDAYELPSSGFVIDINQSIINITKGIMNHLNPISDIGIIGLGVMGTSLARNIGRNGFELSIYNRHIEGKEEDVAKIAKAKYSELKNAMATDDLTEFVNSLSTPRKVLVMVNAGSAVDAVCQDLIPLLESGDLIIDGGNSHFEDTNRRNRELQKHGVLFIGTGVSGGEEGALNGPSIMPGGNLQAYRLVQPIFETISAKNEDQEICCNYIGKEGAGHFVKMVHNGVEYAEMQLICELYEHLRFDSEMQLDQIATIFEQWNQGIHQSYLLGITVDILRKRDTNGDNLLDQILDKAGNKGTGSWTTISAAKLGVPIPTITAALFARFQSSLKKQRVKFSKEIQLQNEAVSISVSHLAQLYYLCRIANHQQGFTMIAEASRVYNWGINLKNLAQTWSGGCIIKSKLLKLIRNKINDDQGLLFTIEEFRSKLIKMQYSLTKTMSTLTLSNRAYPCMHNSVDYLKYSITSLSSANLIQAQRDYFGAHMYKKVDDPDGPAHHTIWQTQ